jgi:excinuclease ABC subunit C
MMYLRGSRKTITVQIEKAMTAQAKAHNFEEASKLRNKLYALKNLERQVIFGDRELMDISKDNGLLRLEKLLGLPAPPRRIEGFDISHLQGTDNVASMVVFVAGVPNKGQYRKFKLRIGGNDDFAHMREVITRRLQPRNVKAWGLPELLLIDGGKGQVSAAQGAVQELGCQIPLIGLAKRHEEIIVPKSIGQFEVLQLPKNDDGLKLLMRIRDESHRFAVSYHSTIRKQRQTASQLDDIPGIGPATRKALIKHFGSTKSLNLATEEEVAKVVGKSKAKLITSQRSSV